MLNSKDRYVQAMKEHFGAIGVGIELDNKRFIFRDSILNITIVAHLLIALLAVQLMLVFKQHLYFSTVLLLYAVFVYIICWEDYKSVNIIELDLQQKNFQVTSRSFIRRLLFKYLIPQPEKYYFEEIRLVEMTDNSSSFLLNKKHLVNFSMKNGERIALISFSSKTSSILFSEFITLLIA